MIRRRAGFVADVLIDRLTREAARAAATAAIVPKTTRVRTSITLPFFRTFVPSLWPAYLPAIPGTSPKQYAVLDAIRFPSDDVPPNVNGLAALGPRVQT